MIGYEPKVKKQTTATLIDINRVYLQVWDSAFRLSCPVNGCGRHHCAVALTSPTKTNHNYTIFCYLNQNFRPGDSSLIVRCIPTRTIPPASDLPKSRTLGLIPPIDALQTNRVNVRTPPLITIMPPPVSCNHPSTPLVL